MSHTEFDSRFTKVPTSSLAAYGSDYLESVLCALIVDPEDAFRAAERFGGRTPHSFNDFARAGGVEELLITLAQWAESMTIERSLDEISAWDPRIAAWVAATCLRTSAQSIPATPAIFEAAVEEIEDYAVGKKGRMHTNGSSIMDGQARRYANVDTATSYLCYAAADALRGEKHDGFRRSVVACVEALYRQLKSQRVTRDRIRTDFELRVIPQSLLSFPVRRPM